MRKRKKIITILLSAVFAIIQTLPTVPISATENFILKESWQYRFKLVGISKE